MAGTPWNKGLTAADPRVAAGERKRRSARIYCTPYPESGKAARQRRYMERKLERDPYYERAKAASHRARRAGVRIEPVSFVAVVERDGMRCGVCSRAVEAADLSFDHIRPLRLGGPHAESNLQVSHATCNSRKGELEARHLRVPSVRKGVRVGDHG